MPIDVEKALETNGKLNVEKSPWNPHWQLVTEYVCQRKAVFTNFQEPGPFLNSEIWSDTAPKAAEIAASALIGLMWPDSTSFDLEPFGDLKDDKETVEWFKKTVNPQLQAGMDDPEAGLAMSLDEAMLDFLILGTPALHCEEGDTTDFKFDAWNVSQFAIDEGPDGFVDTIDRTFSMTVRQAATKFGLENLSKVTQASHNGKKYMDKVKILHVIEPRQVDRAGGKGPQNMPIASCYIEVDAKHLIKESGFNEMPTFVFRYSKRIGEKYGRSPAMRALPSIMELNALWEIYTMAAEKTCDLPLAVYDDGTFGGGTIDTSAGAINVINVSGKLTGNRAPIEPIQTVGTFTDIEKLIDRLENTINDHFMIDRLLDMNNEHQMTAREALIRDAIRQGTLRSPISRIWAELFNRLIPRCFNIQLRKGRYGYVAGSPEMMVAQATNPGKEFPTIPAKIVEMQGKNQRVYQIRYRSPAARQQQSDQAQGILNITGYLNEAAAVDPSARHRLNVDRASKKLGSIWGVPEECWNSDKEFKALINADATAQEKATELTQAEQLAGIAKDVGAARKGNVPASASFAQTGL